MQLDFEKEIVLEDERVVLRTLALNDLENLLPVASSDDKLVQYSPKPIHSRELLSQYIDTAVKSKALKIRYPFIIYDKQLKAFAGSTSYLNIDEYNLRLEIGHTWIGKNFQRTGLNRHCKFLLLSYTFDTLNYERVEFRTDERNITSRNAIEKLGAKLEGILRSHMVMNDGFRRNTVCYSILSEEWQAIKENGVLHIKR